MGLFIIFLLSSCNNDYDVQRDDATSRVDSNFVSLKNAKSIATTYEFTNLKTRSKIGKKNIASIYSLKKKSGLPEMYVLRVLRTGEESFVGTQNTEERRNLFP